MFSTTIQTRPSLTHLIPHLLSSTPPLQASPLTTHDLEFPLPHTSLHPNRPRRNLLVLVLTAADISDEGKEAETTRKLERFASLTGGEGCILAFLRAERDEGNAHGSEVAKGRRAYARLQILVHTHRAHPPLPLLPIPTPSSLLPTLQTYIATLSCSPAHSANFTMASSSLLLLPHSISKAPHHPLTVHETYVLSDLCPDLASVASMTQSGDGREVLRGYLGEEVGRGVEEFWGEEWVLE